VTETAPDPAFEALLEYVREHRGFDYAGYKRPSLVRRFAKRAESVGASTWAEYRAVLDGDPAEYEALFDTILINVTSFFRDASTWDFIRDDVIPRILAQRPTGAIRVWSAGCASGEEACTLAILFAEALGADAFRDRVKIYATDLDEDALAEARQAVYTAKQVEAVPEPLREAYFQPVPPEGKFAFRHDIRRCVIFGRNELLNDPPISRVDLLVSRNTLMYFGREAQQRILSNYYFALAPDGFLVVGKAEALQTRSDLFEAYDLKRRIFVKTLGADVGPRRAMRMPPVEAATNGHAENGSQLRQASFEQAQAAEIVVDTASEIAAINRAARTLFGLKPQDIGRPLRDLEVSYRPLELRSLIEQVQTARTAVTARDVSWTVAGGEPRILDVQVTPLVTSTGELAGSSVTFVDVTRYRSLQDELDQTRRDLETAYEQLQSTVEELETTNEELQSTNEELETMNEELHSTNEELETMNEELQSTNEELETTNDELRDRTDEALHVNAFVTSVLKNIPQAVIVVDREMHVSSWSENAADAWGLREAEVRGANFLNLDIGLPVAALRDPIRTTLSGEDPEPVIMPGHNRRGQAVVCTIAFAQLRAHDGSVIGAILLVDAARDDDA
jgi:two-component system CheB/CheR fusion protein